MTAATIVELESQHTESEASPLAVLGLSGTALLTACGGGGGDATSTTPAATPDNSLANNLALTDASRFLRQASWGGTSSEIKSLAATDQQGWLIAQFNAPQGQTLTRWLIEKGFNDASTSNNVNGDGGWVQSIWWKLFSATDLFRQRATLALSELFVVSQLGLPFSWRNFAIANYWEILEANALGNFRTLLESVTLSSAMGTYLNMKGNQKYDAKTGRSPDENYAREVMQ